MTTTAVEPAQERHASWIELFFDLVVVAGVGQLAHLLHDEFSAADLALCAVLYLAFWITWSGFTVYGNIAGERIAVSRMLAAMVGLGVMAAAVPGIRGDHAVAFAVAYVALRWLAGRIWRRGQVVVDWPLAQYGVGSVPWLVSVWTEPPVRYRLWALGIALDLAVTLLASRGRMIEGAERRLEQVRQRRGPARLDLLRPEAEHLGERLGLFLIIVLGEGVIQIVDATGEVEQWTGPLFWTALAAFLLLVGIWSLSLPHGFAGIPHLDADTMPVRYAMALHALITALVAALATGLGLVVGEHEVGTGERWLVCGALAGYFGVATATGVAARVPRRWLLGWGLPCTLLPLALAAAGTRFPAPSLLWLLALTVYWQHVYRARAHGG